MSAPETRVTPASRMVRATQRRTAALLRAFWRVNVVEELQYRANFVASLLGTLFWLAMALLTLALLPPTVQTAAGVLWFPYVLAFPVDILTGAATTPAAYARGFAGQVVWLVVWAVAYRVVWSRGLRRYGAVGG